MTFDISRGILVWAQTVGDEYRKSSCHILASAPEMKDPQMVLPLDNCYPFSLTVDEKYIYWTDWGQEGIMRASLTDPKDVVKLVHTPAVNSTSPPHHGAYGLTRLSGPGKQALQESCKSRPRITTQDRETKDKSFSDDPSQGNIGTEEVTAMEDYVSDMSVPDNDQETKVANSDPDLSDGGSESKPLHKQVEEIVAPHQVDKSKSSPPPLSVGDDSTVETVGVSVSPGGELKIQSVQDPSATSHSSTPTQGNSSLVKEEM